MTVKQLTILCVSTAILASAIAAIVVSIQNTEKTRLVKATADAREATADAQRKAAQKTADAEADKRRAAEADAKAKADALAAAKAAKETEALAAETAEANAKAKAAEAEKAKADANRAIALREAEKAKATQAREARLKAEKEAEIEAHKAAAEAEKREMQRLKNERDIADVRRLELRKLNFDEAERELNNRMAELREKEIELNEREAALRPEKTIADLSWVGGDEDMVVGSNGTVVVRKKVPYLAENDRSLPEGTRQLAKAERVNGEETTSHASQVRESVVRELEALYVEAIKDERVIDADFYKKSLKALYPDWEFKGEQEKKEEEK